MLSVFGGIIITAADLKFIWRARKSLTKKILTGKVNIVYISITNANFDAMLSDKRCITIPAKFQMNFLNPINRSKYAVPFPEKFPVNIRNQSSTFFSDSKAVLKKAETDHHFDAVYISRRIIGLPSETRSYGVENGATK